LTFLCKNYSIRHTKTHTQKGVMTTQTYIRINDLLLKDRGFQPIDKLMIGLLTALTKKGQQSTHYNRYLFMKRLGIGRVSLNNCLARLRKKELIKILTKKNIPPAEYDGIKKIEFVGAQKLIGAKYIEQIAKRGKNNS